MLSQKTAREEEEEEESGVHRQKVAPGVSCYFHHQNFTGLVSLLFVFSVTWL